MQNRFKHQVNFLLQEIAFFAVMLTVRLFLCDVSLKIIYTVSKHSLTFYIIILLFRWQVNSQNSMSWFSFSGVYLPLYESFLYPVTKPNCMQL